MMKRFVSPRRQSAFVLAATLALLVVPPRAQDQEVPEDLTLAEAVELARRNNPDCLSQENDLVTAQWGVRSACGALLPWASGPWG